MRNIDSLDLVVGIPSYNEADNIEFVVRQVAAGLEQYFPHLSTAIINADNCSRDGTKDAFIAADSGPVPKVYLSTPAGVKGKGNNFRNLFKYSVAISSQSGGCCGRGPEKYSTGVGAIPGTDCFQRIRFCHPSLLPQ